MVGLCEAQVPDHSQGTILAHRTGYIQLAVVVERDLHNGILHIALDHTGRRPPQR